MASTETTAKDAGGARAPKDDAHDLAGLEAGLDALDAVRVSRTPVRQVLVQKVLPRSSRSPSSSSSGRS